MTARGNLGLNGEGQGTLRFDLAAYAGKTITLRLHYTSDVGVQWAGWWADDFTLADGATTLFSDDVEAGPDGWTTNGLVIVPLTRTYPSTTWPSGATSAASTGVWQYPYHDVYNNDATTSGRSIAAPTPCPACCCGCATAPHDFDYTL